MDILWRTLRVKNQSCIIILGIKLKSVKEELGEAPCDSVIGKVS